MLTPKSCASCGAWQSMTLPKGECRKNAPTAAGWPSTSDTDWCCQWLKNERPKAPVEKEEKIGQIGFNYVFVRDYPEKATTWLAAAKASTVPEALQPVLSDLLGNILTAPMPNWAEGRPCCESLLCWAEQLSGFCNDDTADDKADYMGLLMSMEDKDEVAASLQALAEIPTDHPWRNMA